MGTLGTRGIVVGTGISSEPLPLPAAQAVCMEAMAHLNASGQGQGCDLALLFSTGFGPGEVELLSRSVGQLTGASYTSGCTGGAVFTESGAIEGERGVALMVIRGLAVSGIMGRDLHRDPAGAAHVVAKGLAHNADPSRESLVLTFSHGRPPPRFLSTLSDELSPSAHLLGAAATTQNGRIFPQGETMSGGSARNCAAALRLGCTRIAWGVAQSTHPVSDALQITQAGHAVLQIDGRPAAEVLLDIAGPAAAKNLAHIRQELQLATRAVGPGQRTHCVTHRIVGIDPQMGVISLDRPMPPNTPIYICRRDPDRARQDLDALLRDMDNRAPRNPAFGLMLLGGPGGTADRLDPARIHEALPGTPLIGCRTGVTIGALEGRPYSLEHSAALALLA
jgi:small ligand-binding sensory domain FIST